MLKDEIRKKKYIDLKENKKNYSRNRMDGMKLEHLAKNLAEKSRMN
jgi:hypothetical protein